MSIITVVEYPPALGYAEVVLYPTRLEYLVAVKWQSELRARGIPLPPTDLIIATQAVNRKSSTSGKR